MHCLREDFDMAERHWKEPSKHDFIEAIRDVSRLLMEASRCKPSPQILLFHNDAERN